MKIKYILALCVAFGFLTSSVAFAEDPEPFETGAQKIKWIKAQGNGVHLLLDGFSDANETCVYSSFFMNINEDANYDAKVSALLSAHVRKADVNIFYSQSSDDCYGDLIRVGDVELVN